MRACGVPMRATQMVRPALRLAPGRPGCALVRHRARHFADRPRPSEQAAELTRITKMYGDIEARVAEKARARVREARAEEARAAASAITPPREQRGACD